MIRCNVAGSFKFTVEGTVLSHALLLGAMNVITADALFTTPDNPAI